jgi:hypothetical protein
VTDDGISAILKPKILDTEIPAPTFLIGWVRTGTNTEGRWVA